MDEYEILELVKDRYRTGSIKPFHIFLLNDTTIISNVSYQRLYKQNPSISKQVIGYVFNDPTNYASALEFPLLRWNSISPAYLYKIGYVIREDSRFGPAPLPNLKYIIHSIKTVTQYEFKDRLVIELADLDVVSNNLNLPKIVSSVLGPKLLSENKIIEPDELDKIVDWVISQKFFAGHTWDDAEVIVFRYFDQNERELSKEVFKISEAYERVFIPYRVVYNTKTWQPVMV